MEEATSSESSSSRLVSVNDFENIAVIGISECYKEPMKTLFYEPITNQ